MRTDTVQAGGAPRRRRGFILGALCGLAVGAGLVGLLAGGPQQPTLPEGPLQISGDYQASTDQTFKGGTRFATWTVTYTLHNTGSRPLRVRLPPLARQTISPERRTWAFIPPSLRFGTVPGYRTQHLAGDPDSEDWFPAFNPPRDLVLQPGGELSIPCPKPRPSLELGMARAGGFPLRDAFVFGTPEERDEEEWTVVGTIFVVPRRQE